MSASTQPDSTFTLPTGAVRKLYLVDYDAASRRFLLGAFDVSAYLSPSQKRTFPDYDPTYDLAKASDDAQRERGVEPAPVGETSAWSLFWSGVGDDLAKGAEDIRETVGIGRENAGKGSPAPLGVRRRPALARVARRRLRLDQETACRVTWKSPSNSSPQASLPCSCSKAGRCGCFTGCPTASAPSSIA